MGEGERGNKEKHKGLEGVAGLRKEKEEEIWIKEGKGSKEEEDLKEIEIKMRGLEIRME